MEYGWMRIRMGEKIEQWMYRAMLLFPIGTLLPSRFSILNKGIFGISFLLLLYQIAKSRKGKWEWIVYGAAVFLQIAAFVQTKTPLHNGNERFYFLFFLLFFGYVVGNREGLFACWTKDRGYIQAVLAVWALIVGVSLFFPSSYQNIWGTEYYFVSFTGQAARFASSAFFVLVLCFGMFVRERKKRYAIGSIVPVACLYLSGSRTYLGIGMLVVLLLWYALWRDKKIFYWTVVPLLAGLVLLMGVSVMKDKWESAIYENGEKTDNYELYGFLGALSNSRTAFWNAGWDEYEEMNLPGKLLGGGYNLPYEVFYESMGVYTWMHNDFLQILLIYGAVGLAIYVAVMRALFGQMLPRTIPVFLRAIVVGVWLLNACWNMFYTYTCAMVCYPFLLAAFQMMFAAPQGERPVLKWERIGVG